MREKPARTYSVVRTANKPHTCLTCGEAILKGHYYTYAKQFSHDPIMYGHFCASCIEITL